MKNNKTNSILGVIALSAAMAVGILLNQKPQPINLKTHELQALMIHTSASPEGRNTKANQIASYHTRPKTQGGLGWNKPGYNDIFELDGTVVNLIAYNEDTIVQPKELANGACEYNRIVRHVCYVGGMDSAYKHAKNTLTPAQDSALKNYVLNFIKLHPSAWIMGHNQVCSKDCPSFDVPTKCREWGVPEKNIYKNGKKYKNKYYEK